jgi:hypothetical protein
MAITALAAFGRVLGKLFAPYVEKLLPQMIELCQYLNSQIRENAVRALPDMLHVVHDSFPSPGGKWERGKFNGEKPLSRQVHNINTPVMRTLLDVAKEDRDLEVVICAIEAIDRIIKGLHLCCPVHWPPFLTPRQQSLDPVRLNRISSRCWNTFASSLPSSPFVRRCASSSTRMTAIWSCSTLPLTASRPFVWLLDPPRLPLSVSR